MINDMNTNLDWLREMTEKEDNATLSTGGLVSELREQHNAEQTIHADSDDNKRNFLT